MKKIMICALAGMAVLGAGLFSTPSHAIDFSRIDNEAPNEGYGAQYGGATFDAKKMDERTVKTYKSDSKSLINFSRIDKEAPNEGYGAQYGGAKFDAKKMDEGKINPRILDEDKPKMKH